MSLPLSALTFHWSSIKSSKILLTHALCLLKQEKYLCTGAEVETFLACFSFLTCFTHTVWVFLKKLFVFPTCSQKTQLKEITSNRSELNSFGLVLVFFAYSLKPLILFDANIFLIHILPFATSLLHLHYWFWFSQFLFKILPHVM